MTGDGHRILILDRCCSVRTGRDPSGIHDEGKYAGTG